MVSAVSGGSGGEAPATAKSAKGLRSHLLTLLKLALSVFAITTVALTVDLPAAWHRMVGQNLWLLAAAAAIMVVQIVLGGLRWHVILRELDAPVRLPDSIRLFFIAGFFNAWLWGAVGGDVIRVWLSYRGQLSASTAVNSVILDRVAAVAGVAVLVLATAPLFIHRVGYVMPALVPVAVAGAGLLGIAVAAQIHRLPLDWQRSRLLRAFQDLSSATRTIFLRPAAALRVLGLAVTVQVIMAFTAFVIARSLNVGLSFLDSLVLMQPVALITALPISVGGWGVRETAMIGLLGLVGIPSSAALSISVQLGFLVILTTLPGALFWLRMKDRAIAR